MAHKRLFPIFLLTIILFEFGTSNNARFIASDELPQEPAKRSIDVAAIINRFKGIERSFDGLKINVKFESEKLKGTEVIETTTDGAYRRIATIIELGSQEGSSQVTLSNWRYVSLRNIWAFCVGRQSSEPGDQNSLLFLKDDQQRVLGRGGFVAGIAAGIIDGRFLSDFVGECATKGTVSLAGNVLTCNHPTNGSITVSFDTEGDLIELRVVKRAGDYVLDSGPSVEELSEQLYDHFEYDIRGNGKLIAAFRHTLIPEPPRLAVVTNYSLQASTFKRYLEDDIELPDVKIKNGTVVQVEGPNGVDSIRHEYLDGRIVKVADDEALGAARELRYRKPSRRSSWYVLMSVTGFGLIGLLMWLRSRTG